MSACRKSCATVSESVRPLGSMGRPRRLQVEQRKECGIADRCVLAGERPAARSRESGALPRCPSAAVAATRTASASSASTMIRRSGSVAIADRTSPSVSTSRLRDDGAAHPEQGPLDADDEKLRHGRRPQLERALGEHAGEAPGHDEGEEAADGLGPRHPVSHRPGCVLPHEGPIVVQQRHENTRRLAVVDLGESMDRRDHDELIAALDGATEHPERPHPGVAPRFEREVVGQSHAVDDGGRLLPPHRVKSESPPSLLIAYATVPRPRRGPPRGPMIVRRHGRCTVEATPLTTPGRPVHVIAIGDIGVTDGMMHIGDEAMFEALVDELRARGVTSITGLSAAPDESAERYGIRAIDRIGFPAARAEGARRFSAVLAALSGAQQLPAGDPFHAVRDAVAEADGVVIAGGGNMASNWPLHIFERAALARIAAHYGKPLVITGQTLGPALSAEDRPILARGADLGATGGAPRVGFRHARSRAGCAR